MYILSAIDQYYYEKSGYYIKLILVVKATEYRLQILSTPNPRYVRKIVTIQNVFDVHTSYSKQKLSRPYYEYYVYYYRENMCVLK